MLMSGGGLGKEVRTQFGEAACLTSESLCLVCHRFTSPPLGPRQNEKRVTVVLSEIKN